jgi:HEAT repeat protein
MTPKNLLACLATSLALATASAQTTLDPRLRAAELAEKSENDLPRAIAILEGIYADRTATPKLRVEVGRRLTDLLRRAGRDAEASHIARAIADLAVEHGIADPPSGAGQDPALRRQIEQLIETVSTTGDAGSIGRLAWIGERALSQLETACRKENQVARLSNLLAVVVAIGGERAEAMLARACADEDPLRRRAVALAFASARAQALGVRIRPSVLGVLAEDRDPEVRADALRNGLFGTIEAYLINLRDVDPRVRAAVLDAGFPAHGGFAEDIATKGAAIVELAETIADDAAIATFGHSLLGCDWFRRTSPTIQATCWLALARSIEFVAHPELVGFPPDSLAERLCVTVEGARSHSIGQRNWDALTTITRTITASWTGKSLPHWLRLLKAGMVGDPDVFERNATPADRHRLLAETDIFAMVGGQAEHPANRVARAALGDLPDDAFETLQSILKRIVEAPSESKFSKTASSWSYGILRRMASFESPAAIAWSEATLLNPASAGLVPGLYQPVMGTTAPAGVWDAVESSDSEPIRRLRNKIMVTEGDNLAILRNLAFLAALRTADRDALAHFPRAYELGLDSRSGQRGISIVSSLSVTDVDADFVLAALEACVAAGNANAWEDAQRSLHWLMNQLPARPVVPVLLQHVRRVEPSSARADWFERLARACVTPTRESDGKRLGEVFAIWLGDSEPYVLQHGLRQLGMLPEPWPQPVRQLVESLVSSEVGEVRARAVQVLCRTTPAVATEQLLTWLRSEDRQIANSAANVLMARDPVAAVDHLMPHLEQKRLSPSLGQSLAIRTMDTRLVPMLLRDLRSDNPEYRTAARAALDAIEYYTQQERRWQKLVAAGGVEAKDPAEALLHQAREAKGELRLLAIESLGTLGKPEVLPFLIDMLGTETDDTVKVQLRASITRINAQR